MLALEKWMDSKPPKSFMFQIFGSQVAITARDLHEGFETIRDRRIGSHTFSIPANLNSWFAIYRQHRKPMQFLKKLFSDFSGFSDQTVSVFENAANELKKLAKQGNTKITLTQKQLHQVRQIQNAIRAEAIAEIKNDIAAYRRKGCNIEAKDRMLSFLDNAGQDAAFFMLVFAPCWLMYRTSPSKLYRKARQSDYPSIEKLLELDPIMIHDPYIGRAIQRFRFRRKTHLYRKLMEIPSKEVTVRVTSQHVKYALGGFLSAFAKLAGQKLTSPDIKRLYDAVAKDFDDQLEDHELPVGDTFARAISRYRIDWLKALKSDMKK